MGNVINAPENFVTSVIYVDYGDALKAVVACSARTYAFADMGKKRYKEVYNDKEPYDFKTHVFMLDKLKLTECGCYYVTFIPQKVASVFTDMTDALTVKIDFDPSAVYTVEEMRTQMDRGLRFVSKTESVICDGVEYSVENYVTSKDEPVVAYFLKYDSAKAYMYTGTPNGVYEYKNQKQTVMAEAEYAMSSGKKVVAAFNADFFDMFGDCAPSGLCVKDGRIIANPDSERYFFGIKKDGETVIDTLAGNPLLLAELDSAVSGINLMMENGCTVDVGEGEPFGYTPHPRTYAALCEDGRVMVAVVDGRRPWHSNGSSLMEGVKLLKAHGAVKAINLDGGGSSTFIIRNAEGKLEMLNHPADLHRPYEDLIRDVYNTVLICEK